MAPEPVPELLHFRYSPYNEKVRWALDLKRVPHQRRSLMPGPHMPVVRKRTGQTATPVLLLGDAWLAGSAAIVAALEERHPEPALYPADPALRDAALATEKRFDEDFAPRMRRALLGTMLDYPGYMTEVFAGDKPWALRLPYRATFPLAKGMISKGNGIEGPQSIEDGMLAAAAAFDFVAERRGESGYLVGDAFSIADLAAACVLATLLDMDGTPMERPRPRPAAVDALWSRWSDHPGAEWTRDVFARHRGTGAGDNGLIDYA